MSQPPEDGRWPTYPPQPPEAGGELVVPAPSDPVAVPDAPSPGPLGLARPGYSPQDPLVLRAGSGGLTKDKPWTVPPYLSIPGDLGSVRLDFRRAQMISQLTWIQVSGGVGSILLIVPDGWAVQLDRLAPGIGSKQSTVDEEPVGDNPVLVLAGSLGLGSLKVRYPNRGDERRLRRGLRREQRRSR